jgi:site-specific recombinase XerD
MSSTTNTGTLPRTEDFRVFLQEQERAHATIERYMSDLRKLEGFLTEQYFANRTHGREDRDLQTDTEESKEVLPDRQTILAYKEWLGRTMAISSANSMLASLNVYLRYVGREDLCVHRFRQQRDLISFEEKELTQEEIRRLIAAARRKRQSRLALAILTLAGCGARVSELQFFTVEGVRRGSIEIRMKGKTRRIPLAGSLRREILLYCQAYGIESGPVFITHSGAPMDRSNFWRSMQRLGPDAKIAPMKLHPHNLRHSFARAYYKKTQDLTGLADLLGHSSVNVTRIYTAENGNCYKKTLDSVCENVWPIEADQACCNENATKKQHNVSYVVRIVPIVLGFESNVTISPHNSFCNMLRKYFQKHFRGRIIRQFCNN